MDPLHSNRGPFRRLIKYDRARYMLRIDYNERIDDCKENRCLDEYYEASAMDDRERIFDDDDSCVFT